MTAQGPAVFLDRDGTLNEDVGFLDRLERLRLFPWAIDAVRVLNRAGFKVIVVTNQGGVARGLVEEAFVAQVEREIGARVAAAGGRIDGWYYCPHEKHAAIARYRCECDCRKPLPGMVRRAEAEHGIDAARSYVIGDKWGDVQLGRNVGARAVLVRTGYGASEELRPPEGTRADHVADNLIEAVTWILRNGR